VNISVSMEKGLLLASAPEVCPEELEEPDLEDDPEALCADDSPQQRQSAARREIVVRTETRFMALALFLLLAIRTAPRERGQQIENPAGGFT
jgi:hypothetical protein